jgi:CzcA family heavy metal efflux pump
VWLATLVLVLLGISSAAQMPSGIYPEVEFPRIVVVAKTGGAPPDLFLTKVTRPLEQALASVLGLQRIRSKTIRGATEISLQFAPGTDMWRALQLTESRVADVRSVLPPGTDIVTERVTTGSFPVVTFNVAGSFDPRELREMAEFVVRPALANVPGVGRIEVLGGDVREVEVVLDPEVTAAVHLTPENVAEKLRTSMSMNAVGRLERSDQHVTVLADALPRTVAEIAEVPVASAPSSGALPLGSIAEVFEGHEDRLIRIGGPRGETVSVSVARLPGASTTAVVDAAIAAVKALRPTLPEGVSIEPVYDQASLVRESMASVRDAILMGIALSAVVIGLFLRDWRAGIICALAVPVTLAVSFGAMRLAHQTLNLMSLGGMAVAIGLVVDDAIVTIESIARHRDLGAPPDVAATTGTAALARAVIGTTLTTVVVFVPLGFLEGVVGDFFRSLAFTLSAAVLVSLAVALMLVPLAASLWLPRRPSAERSRLFATYDRVTRSLASRPGWVLAAIALVVVGGALVEPFVGKGFLPTMDEGAFVLDYFLPAGTSLPTTEKFAKALEHELKDTREVLTFTRRTGAELGPAAATHLNRGDLMVRLVARSQRSRSAEEVISDVRSRIETKYPEVRVEFMQVLQDVLNDLSGAPRPIEVKLFGPDYAKLHELADSLSGELHDVPGLVDLYKGHERETPELRFAVQRDALARLGATPDDVSRQLETALLGQHVGDIRRFDRLVGVRVRYPDPVRFDRARVLDLPFVASDRAATFRAVANIEGTTSPSELLHEALQPMVDITGDHENRDLGSVGADVETKARSVKLPSGYRIVLGGQLESQRATIRDLLSVGGVALVLVLTVLAAQFRRLRLALLVIGTVPIAIVGGLIALFVTGAQLNASSLMGCVLLIGLVVKNGVLLLEEAETALDEGATGFDAVIRASERRLRPVMMTTIATLAGLFPLALGIGAGAELQRPLAIAVIGGLVTSTLATLGFVPALASWILSTARRLGPR